MTRLVLRVVLVVFLAAGAVAQQTNFRVLAFYSTKTEPDHVQFAEGAIKFFNELAPKDHFTFNSTTNWDDLNDANLGKYQVVVWLNDFPSNAAQRQAFQNFMEHGGAWLGFHVAAYNDADTHWPWLVDFLGGGVFYINSWPPLPAKLVVEDRTHPATKNLPESYLSPANEWYIWKPSPRLNKDVRVLVSLDPSNYPVGLKDVLISGDLPVVWTNTKFKMLYMNTGHGDKIFTSPTQNQVFEDALVGLGTNAVSAKRPSVPVPAPVLAMGTLISPRGIAMNTKTNKMYAANTGGGAVTVLHGVPNITSAAVKVENEPVAITVNPLTNKIYVANTASGSVSVIDGATDTVTATVKVGDLPYVVATNPTTNKVYVSRTFSNDITVIDGATNTTSTLKAGVQPDAIGVNAATSKLYLIGYEGADVTIIDGVNDSITRIPMGTHLWSVAVNPETNKIYFTNSGSSSVAVLDGATNRVTSVATGDLPCAVAVDPVANKVYVANYSSDNLTVIDGTSNRVTATIAVGTRPQAVAVDPQTHRVFVANTESHTVSVIDVAKDGAKATVIATVKVGGAPYAIAIDGAYQRAYVATVGAGVTIIDGSTLTAILPTGIGAGR